MSQLIFIALVALITVLFAKLDGDCLARGHRFQDHTSRFILRAVTILGLSQSVEQAVLGTAIFYLLFDYTLNVFWGKPVMYQGNTAVIDRFWHGRPYTQLVFKFTFLIFATILNI